MKRIGLFGGSFDPVHNAHLALAQVALDHLALDELRWMPAGQPWQKTRAMTPAEHRAAMVQAAIVGEPRFVLERCEIERSGPTYTLDTVRALAGQEPDAIWFLVIGQDQYARLSTWHGWQELLGLATLAVAARAGEAPHADAATAAQSHTMVTLPLPRIDVSATDIRRRAAAGEPIDDLVPPAVARYIDQHRLYRGRPGS